MSQRSPTIVIHPSYKDSYDGSRFSMSELFTAPSRRRVIQGCGAALALLVMLGGLHSSRQWYRPEQDSIVVMPDDSLEVYEGTQSMWGLHEEQGWTEVGIPRLVDLGEQAEQAFRLGPTEEYYDRLEEFAAGLPRISRQLQWVLWNHRPEQRRPHEPPKPKLGPPSMIAYKKIHQTDKSKEKMTDETKEWVRINAKDGWNHNYLDDADAATWVDRLFPGTTIAWAWRFMDRGVLRADFLRYLLLLAEGGVYSDVDTLPIRPVEEWGKIDVEYLDISPTDGPDWRNKLSTYPAVIVAIDVNVHAKTDWFGQWPRALGICQWTMSSAPFHPIFLDAARRVVNSTRVVSDFEIERQDKITELETDQPAGWEAEVKKWKGISHSQVMEVMDWTGPGLFSDSVLAFLLARYRVTWHRLRGLDHPIRIGDVMILPITAFSPGGESDFGSGTPDSPQCNVLHKFRGSWKGDGA